MTVQYIQVTEVLCGCSEYHRPIWVILKQVQDTVSGKQKQSRMGVYLCAQDGYSLQGGKKGSGWKGTLLFMVQPFILFAFLPCACVN